MKICHLCAAPQVETLNDFGQQPICNRFPKSATEPEATFPMLLELCKACGLIQNTQPVPAAELRPRVEWITYNEPEGHLDIVADKVAALPELTRAAVVGGISFKDDTLLGRMRERGFASTWRLDPKADLGINEPGAGVEMIQERLTPAAARQIAAKRGKADLLFVRHIFEHTHQPAQFAAALRELTKPGGYVMLEVPDCERALELCDYSTLWEEHVLYFTPATFRQSFGWCGFSLTSFDCFPYTLENSLVGIARVGSSVESKPPRDLLDGETERAQHFSRSLAGRAESYRRFLADYARTHGPVAIFGAGHLACTFINLLGLKEYVEFLVDDHPHKCGLFMPGSRLPIMGSSELVARGIKLALLTVAVESEEKVIQKNQTFAQAGGAFASIFPASRHALKI
jgi:C-methyltransferase-like protein/putative zinc binding protein/methyltransferase family protein